MTERLTELQRRLCNALQDGLVVCRRPFARLAEKLCTDEKTVLNETEALKKAGVIRRIGALIDYRALGLVSTLVAAAVREDKLEVVAAAVSGLEGVSHNYQRQHKYNLWFTLQAESERDIESILSGLSADFGVQFHSLPVERIFKLDVRFDAVGETQRLSQDLVRAPRAERVELDRTEKLILSELQNDLEVTAEPFEFLCGQGLKRQQVLNTISGLIERGVIRRIAGVVDHRKLGYAANVLFCCKVDLERVVEAGRNLSRFGIVSHCYQRRTSEDWPYNLFAMMHGRSIGEIQRVISEFAEAEEMESYELLRTGTEFKKQPVKYRFR